MDYLTTHTSLPPIPRGFAPGFVNYKKWCTLLAAASDKVYQWFAHGRWFSTGTPVSSVTKTGRHDIAEILLKVALNTINQIEHLLGQTKDTYWYLLLLHHGQATDKLHQMRLRVECNLFVIYKAGCERTHAVLVIGLYALLCNPTT